MIRTEWIINGSAEADQIRRRVFIDECGMDAGFITPDDDAQILLVTDGDVPVATGRIKQTAQGWLLGQIAVLPEHRGRAYGEFVIRLLIRRAYEQGAYEQFVNARPQAEGFYRKLGFEACGGTDDGLIRMKHTGDVKAHC